MKVFATKKSNGEKVLAGTLAVSPSGNIVRVPPGQPLKAGWYPADEADIAEAEKVEADRAAKEAAEADAQREAELAAQIEREKAELANGGPLA